MPPGGWNRIDRSDSSLQIANKWPLFTDWPATDHVTSAQPMAPIQWRRLRSIRFWSHFAPFFFKGNEVGITSSYFPLGQLP